MSDESYMLGKIRKNLTMDALLLIHKSAVLYFDYALAACRPTPQRREIHHETKLTEEYYSALHSQHYFSSPFALRNWFRPQVTDP